MTNGFTVTMQAPAMPVPELPSALLMTAGLAALGGVALVVTRKRQA